MTVMSDYPYAIFPDPDNLPQLPEELLSDGRNFYERLKQRAAPEDMEVFDSRSDLLYVMSMSEFVSRTLTQYPKECAQLIRDGALDDQFFSIDPSDVVNERIVAGLPDPELKKRLRVIRRTRMVVIAWRDLTGRADIEEVFVSLSNLAECIVDRTVQVVRETLKPMFGDAMAKDGTQMPLLILGMGKLGGGELNFSSDIDLLACYPYDDDTVGGQRAISHQEYFTKVMQRISNLLSEVTSDSFCYRIDLRLRPFGDAGPLVSSFDALSVYYETQGRTWERYALVKAKLIGDYHKWGTFGDELIELLRPFVYRRYLDYGAIESLRKLKHMIESEVRRRNLGDNFKLGSGGIREVEFIAQVFELMRGGRIPELAERSLRKTLNNIAKLQLLPEATCNDLDNCYIYLRRLENINQMLADKQTQTLPVSEKDQMRLAIGLNKGSYQELLDELEQVRERVHKEFISVMRDSDDEQEEHDAEDVELWESALTAEELEPVLEELLKKMRHEDSPADAADPAASAHASSAATATSSSASASASATVSANATTQAASRASASAVAGAKGDAAASAAAAGGSVASASGSTGSGTHVASTSARPSISRDPSCPVKLATSTPYRAGGNSAAQKNTYSEAYAFAEGIINLHHALNRLPVGPIGRDTLLRLMPKIIRAVAEYKDAPALFKKVAILIEKVALRTTYLQLLVENDGTRQKVLALLDGNNFAGTLISEHPILLDELIAPRYFKEPPHTEEYIAWLNERLLRIEPDDLEEQMEELRLFKKVMVLRIAMSDQSQSLPLMKISDSLTWLAEAILREISVLAWRQTVEKYGTIEGRDEQDPGYAIIAYGKLGGLELGYKSDLDMVFIREVTEANTNGSNSIPAVMFYQRFVQRFMHLCTTRMNRGTIYELDMRLRPDGDSGLLMSDLESYELYQKNRAWTWEHQALVRARAVAGSPRVIEGFNKVRDEVLRTPRDEVKLADDVYAMRMKMRNFLDQSNDKLFHLKQGHGGMVDIEFIAQYLTLREAPKHPDMVLWSDNVRIFDECARLGILSQEDTDHLKDAYLAIRECYHRLSLADLPRVIAIEDRPAACQWVAEIFDEIFKDAAQRFVPPQYNKANALPPCSL